ncbi:hypothetical protein [Ramlibacter pallidus]|uniref:Uncharacterized protein n=1 Tax=Ramlibacter pallidus TaxID=2780087 RepID=A0ABR9RZ09_9BURK|nr:hypothetical protein [Ramlibacter pallidus]MBE7366489.1 hypothetical protein [Ramlibacter pallidus]
MRTGIDFSSWQALFTTLLGLGVVTLVMVGIRLLVMQTVQRRRERENRQINERLRTLIAAYKTLGGSFTGDLSVDPTHLRTARERGAAEASETGGERRRRIRDAVEAALSDVILLGTAEQGRLAVAAATDLVAGRKVETAELVVSLRNFIREALDLEAVPPLHIPRQGPSRSVGAAGRSGARSPGGEGRGAGGGRGGAGGGGAEGLGGMAMGAGAVGRSRDEPP